jgi:DnaD/phage-associated family protein
VVEVGRKTKKGIDYFSLDVTFDHKLDLVIERFGDASFNVIRIIWQLIYKEEGYYIDYNEDLLTTVKKACVDVNEKYIDDIIIHMCKKDLFDTFMFDKYKIITSKRIQTNYFEAIKRRKNVDINIDYVCINNINDYINVGNVNKNTQSKVNKSKVNKNIKEKTTKKENVDNDFSKVFKLLEKEFGITNYSLIAEDIELLLKIHPYELIEYAVKLTIENNVRKFSYAKAILKSYEEHHILNVAQAKSINNKNSKTNEPDWYDQYDKEFKNRKKNESTKDIDLKQIEKDLKEL